MKTWNIMFCGFDMRLRRENFIRQRGQGLGGALLFRRKRYNALRELF